jgi:hypothetical protein
MFLLGQNLRRGPGFDDLALVHHRDPVGHARHDGEIVGDEEEAHLLLGHEVFQEVEDLRLGGDVERGGRFVRDQEPGVKCNGRCDADPLTLAAGKLMRIGVEADMRQAHAVETVPRDGQCLCTVGLAVDGEGLGHLMADGLNRV